MLRQFLIAKSGVHAGNGIVPRHVIATQRRNATAAEQRKTRSARFATDKCACACGDGRQHALDLRTVEVVHEQIGDDDFIRSLRRVVQPREHISAHDIDSPAAPLDRYLGLGCDNRLQVEQGNMHAGPTHRTIACKPRHQAAVAGTEFDKMRSDAIMKRSVQRRAQGAKRPHDPVDPAQVRTRTPRARIVGGQCVEPFGLDIARKTLAAR
jgi:hypothetical protein